MILHQASKSNKIGIAMRLERVKEGNEKVQTEYKNPFQGSKLIFYTFSTRSYQRRLHSFFKISVIKTNCFLIIIGAQQNYKISNKYRMLSSNFHDQRLKEHNRKGEMTNHEDKAISVSRICLLSQDFLKVKQGRRDISRKLKNYSLLKKILEISLASCVY